MKAHLRVSTRGYPAAGRPVAGRGGTRRPCSAWERQATIATYKVALSKGQASYVHYRPSRPRQVSIGSKNAPGRLSGQEKQPCSTLLMSAA
eukprot:4890754-Heterocapsa_arctica.AAC.1